ncbi:hypothetical protein Q4543_11375 [Salipiger sp. 1_MG-2023]|nr:hypothetical protein [Salipiger sp. 1_MG-2023]MDO6586124.1 hypothetical protein [Salipiger sp. 1_MG-2023]
MSGRADIGFAEMIDMDLFDVGTGRIGRDLLLIVLTVPAVFSGRGAS